MQSKWKHPVIHFSHFPKSEVHQSSFVKQFQDKADNVHWIGRGRAQSRRRSSSGGHKKHRERRYMRRSSKVIENWGCWCCENVHWECTFFMKAFCRESIWKQKNSASYSKSAHWKCSKKYVIVQNFKFCYYSIKSSRCSGRKNSEDWKDWGGRNATR